MSNPRIIGVLAVRDGMLVKSYRYSSWRPAGDVFSALRNLDHWGADEIVVLDISRRGTMDPSILSKIQAARVSTPIAYGGGIRSSEDLKRLMEIGCDRFILETLAFERPSEVDALANVVGAQALILSLPIFVNNNQPLIWRPHTSIPLDEALPALLGLPVSEFMVTSVEHEGCSGQFALSLIDSCSALPKQSVIWFGGLDIQKALKCLCSHLTTAVALGNALHETELALPRLRKAALQSGAPIRTFRLC